MKFYECKWLDRSLVLTSYPPQYRCALGFGSHYADHECEYEFMPIVYCRDCKYFEPNHEDIEYKPCNGVEWCNNWCGGTTAGGYCHEAERKES